MKAILHGAVSVVIVLATGCPVARAATDDGEIGPFERPADARPVIAPNPDSVFACPMRKRDIHWEATHTFNPAAVVRNGKVCVLYRAEDDQGRGIGGYTSRIGLAESDDGIHFRKLPEPVLYPAEDGQKDREWFGGCEDPRLMELEDGTYVLFYTQYSRPEGKPWSVTLGMAASEDLIHWEKKGPVIITDSAGVQKMPRKSASPVCEVRGDRLIAARIDGRYWIYYGEGEIRAASSADLVHWRPEGGVLLRSRAGCFDSGFPEAGPPAVLTEKGIVLLYNGKNAKGDQRDPKLSAGVYCGGQALFDAKDPTKLLFRPESPFFQPELDWEKTGQYGDGTTFIEGLVLFEGRWFLYYGCADSFVGVTVSERASNGGSR